MAVVAGTLEDEGVDAPDAEAAATGDDGIAAEEEDALLPLFGSIQTFPLPLLLLLLLALDFDAVAAAAAVAEALLEKSLTWGSCSLFRIKSGCCLSLKTKKKP